MGGSDTSYTSDDKAYYISLPILSVCSLFMLILVLKLIHQLYFRAQYIGIMGFIHKTTTICMVSCLICGILDLYGILECFMLDKYLFDKTLTPFSITNNCIYVIMLILLFGIFIGRLYYTFSDTMYSLSNYFMYFVYFLMITSIICFIPAEIGYASAKENDSLFTYHSSIAIIIISDTILNIMCIMLFIYKLRQISRSLEARFEYEMITVLDDQLLLNEDGYINKDCIDLDHHTKSYTDTINEKSENSSNSSTTQVTEGSNQINLINIIIRHTILSIISIFFNQLWYVILSYYTFIVDATKVDKNTYHYIASLELCIRTLYLAVNTIILFLNLNINHYLYYSICKVCHLCCYKCCTSSRSPTTRTRGNSHHQQTDYVSL